MEKQESNRKDKEEAPQMTKEMEGQMGSQDIGDITKEVQQVYRSPAQAEKGKEYNRDDACPEETSNV